MTKLNIGAMIIFAILFMALAFQGIQSVSNYNQRFNYLTKRLRCESCPNTTVNDSDSASARAIREDIAAMLRQDLNDNAILDKITQEHSTYVAYDPGSKVKVYLLGSSLSLLLGIIFFTIKYLY